MLWLLHMSITLILQEIDHVGYVRQAFEAASLRYFLEILQSDLLNESDVSYFLIYLSRLSH